MVTLLDFESAQEVESHSVVPAYHEMGAIFGPNLLLGRSSGT